MNSRVVSVNLPVYCKKSSRARSLSYFINPSANRYWLLTASQQSSRCGGPSLCPEFGRWEVILTPTARSALMNGDIRRMLCHLQGPFPFLLHVMLTAAWEVGITPQREGKWASRGDWAAQGAERRGVRRLRSRHPLLCFFLYKKSLPYGTSPLLTN